MNAELVGNNEYLQITNMTELQRANIHRYFTKKINNWFVIRQKNPHAVVDESFIAENDVMKAGLWTELVNACREYGYPLSFDNAFDFKIRDCSITNKDFTSYVNQLFSKARYSLKQYQIDGIFSILSYRKCCVEVSTNGGKTLMCYVLFRYLKDVLNIKHILYVTPKTTLTTQSADKFIEYDNECKIETDWTYAGIHSDAKKLKSYDDFNIVFGNYQSLRNKNEDFFSKFECVIVDEAHHTVAQSIKTILRKCKNVKYRVGLTGTFPKEETYNNFVLQAHIGPLVYRFTSYDLINKEHFATPVYVIGMKLRYLSVERLDALYKMRRDKSRVDATDGMRLYKMEGDIARESELRMKYICDLINKTTKNTLVVFNDVKTNYGMRMYEKIKSFGTKNVYYIDGHTAEEKRTYAKDAMEADTSGNTVIISSIGCFSEGIDISNLWNIILTESTKSDVTMAQLLGRGMRRYPGKDKTLLFDIGDDYCYGDDDKYRDNYLYKHFKERINIYKRRGFPYNVYDVNLMSKSLI